MICLLEVHVSEKKRANDFAFSQGVYFRREQALEEYDLRILPHALSPVQALGPRFAGSSEIQALASNFVLINIIDDEEPSDPKVLQTLRYFTYTSLKYFKHTAFE